MNARRLFLDDGPGELRGAVTLDGRPERLLIERAGVPPVQRLGAHVIARVRRIERSLASAFLDLGEGPDAVLALSGDAAKLAEGRAVEIEITGEARSDKGPTARLIGAGEGEPRLLMPAPSLIQRLQSFAPGEPVTEGPLAREAADEAEAAVLAIEHALPGGGSIAIEPTRALTAIDVDLGARGGGDSKRAAKQANLAAIGEAARLLRLKGLGGLVVIDLIGKGHDGAAFAAAAKAAFAPDEPGVSIGPISRFGTFELSIPRRGRPLAELLLGADGTPSAVTVALRLLRALEREGRADPGGRLTALCHPDAAAAAALYIQSLADRIGPRFTLAPDPGLPRDRFEVSAA